MDAKRWDQVGRMFDAALEQDESSRDRFLRDACAGDDVLYREVTSLIEEDRSAHDLLDGMALGASDLLDGMAGDAAGLLDEMDVAGVLGDIAMTGRTIGAYRILHLIGTGGMGAVYLAERADGEFEQRVALKLIKRGMDSQQVLIRFRSERALLARLQHPHIARLLDGGLTSDGRPYFVMEYVDGEPIDAYCDRHRLGIDERLALFLEVCDAVLYAHANLIVHRDLKPENILVTADGHVKLLDFGIAKALEDDDERLTSTTGVVMTPEYASPEQVGGQAVSTATDIYSLGVVLYELLSGVRPYEIDNRSPAAVARVVCTTEPDRPSTALGRRARAGGSEDEAGPLARARSTQVARLRRRLSGDLDVICIKALRKEPTRRYDSIGAFADDVHRHLTGLPVLAQPDTAGYRVRKFITRHRLGVAASFAAALVLAVLVGFHTLRLAQERDRSRAEAQKAQEIAAFLQSIFEVSDPTVAQGETVTARTLLDEGAERVTRELADQPDVQARMMGVIGTVYLSLGLYEPAETLTRQALDIRRRQSPDAPSVAELIDRLGVIRRLRGDYSGAERFAREAIVMNQELFGRESIAVGNSLNNLAETLRLQNDYAAAERNYREALGIRKNLLGEEHRDVADNLNNLALLLHAKGDLEGAEAMHRQALAMRRRLLGERHPDVSNSYNNLAVVLVDRGRYAEADSLYRHALDLRILTLGPDEPRTINTLMNLGLLRYRQGQYDAADSLLQRALSLFRTRMGNDHPTVISALEDWADVLHEKGEYARAEPLYDEALALSRTVLGEHHRQTADIMSDLGNLMREMKRYEEAEPLQRRALAIRRELLGDAHPNVTTSLDNLGIVLLDLGKYAEAMPYFREALGLRRQALGPDHPYVAVPLLGLAAAHHRQGDLAEAETLFREALTLQRNALPAGHVLIAHSLVGLGATLLDAGRTGEAEPLLREAYDLRRNALPKEHWRVAEAASVLGAVLAQEGNFAEAEPLLLDGSRVLHATRGPDDYQTRRADAALAKLYERLGKAGRIAPQ